MSLQQDRKGYLEFLDDMEEINNRRKAHINKVIADIYKELGKEEPPKESWLKNDV